MATLIKKILNPVQKTANIDSAIIIDDMGPMVTNSTVVNNLVIKHAIVLGNNNKRTVDNAIVFVIDNKVANVNVSRLKNATVKAISGALIQRK